MGANLPCTCLQCLTGDQEQTKAGTGGEPLQEALVNQSAYKAIGFLGGPKPHLPNSMVSPFSTLSVLTPASPASLQIALLHSTSSNTSAIFFYPMPHSHEGSDGHQNVCGFVKRQKLQSSHRKENTIKCSKQGFAQIAQASLLTIQECTFLKQKQRIRRMTVPFGNKAVK